MLRTIKQAGTVAAFAVLALGYANAVSTYAQNNEVRVVSEIPGISELRTYVSKVKSEIAEARKAALLRGESLMRDKFWSRDIFQVRVKGKPVTLGISDSTMGITFYMRIEYDSNRKGSNVSPANHFFSEPDLNGNLLDLRSSFTIFDPKTLESISDDEALSLIIQYRPAGQENCQGKDILGGRYCEAGLVKLQFDSGARSPLPDDFHALGTLANMNLMTFLEKLKLARDKANREYSETLELSIQEMMKAGIIPIK